MGLRTGRPLLPFILGRSVGGKRGIIRTFAGIIAKEMRIEQNYSLAEHNTFHLPVKTRWFMEYASEEELGRILRDEYFQECFFKIISNNYLSFSVISIIFVHKISMYYTPNYYLYHEKDFF